VPGHRKWNQLDSSRQGGRNQHTSSTSFSAGELSGADWIASLLSEAPEEVLEW